MNVEEMKIAASRLFSLLGRQGDAHYSVDPATRRQVATLIVGLTPRIHAVVYNKGRRLGLDYLCTSMHARQEIAAEVALRLLRMRPVQAGRVLDPWGYFHVVVLNAINDFQVPVAVGGDDDSQDPNGSDEDDAAGAGAGERDDDSTLGGAHARQVIEKLERMLPPDDFKTLMLKADGYSIREIITRVQGIPQAAVTSRQEAALRQRLSELLKKCRRILGGNLL